jgi:hypothetical protein
MLTDDPDLLCALAVRAKSEQAPQGQFVTA